MADLCLGDVMCWAEPGSRSRIPWGCSWAAPRTPPSHIPMGRAPRYLCRGEQRVSTPGGEAGMSTAAGAIGPGHSETESAGPELEGTGL